MAEQSHQLVQKLWNYCSILRDDGLSYGDYASAWLSTGSAIAVSPLSQMADEQSRPPFNKPSPIPKNVDWQSLGKLNGSQSGSGVSLLVFSRIGGGTPPPLLRRAMSGDLGVEVSSEDIAEARREMWGGFPREDV